MQVVRGSATLNGEQLYPGDGVAIEQAGKLELRARRTRRCSCSTWRLNAAFRRWAGRRKATGRNGYSHKEAIMTKVLVLYYSSYGHIEKMAGAVAEGAREGGADVVVKRVPELVPEELAKKSGFKLDQAAPIATVDELADYDAIIFGTPTRFGNMAAQMRNFLDQTGSLWVKGELIGKVGSVFTSTATQHGGQESTILSTHTVLLHHGMVIVGLPYSFQGQMGSAR